MDYNQEAYKFWTENEEVKHIIPPKFVRREIEFPEGRDTPNVLSNFIGDQHVIEVGCGYGRLVEAFRPSQYDGFDINPSAIKKARELHPDHFFAVYKIGEPLPPSSWVMFYTVLLHVSDDDIEQMLEITTKNCSKVLIAEIMKQNPRTPPRPGKPPAFNRESREYEEYMSNLGFELTDAMKKSWDGKAKQFTLQVYTKKVYHKNGSVT